MDKIITVMNHLFLSQNENTAVHAHTGKVKFHFTASIFSPLSSITFTKVLLTNLQTGWAAASLCCVIMQPVIEIGIWGHKEKCRPNKGTSLTQREHWDTIGLSNRVKPGQEDEPASQTAHREREREGWTQETVSMSVCVWVKKERNKQDKGAVTEIWETK